MQYKVTHKERPRQPRSIGDFYEWSEANEWTQYMDARDAQTFMGTSAIRELTFTAVDEADNPLPAGYPLADHAIVPDGAVLVLVPSQAGPVRTIVTAKQLANHYKEHPQ